ncbi:MAG: methyltransferase domain-containing protein [Candidatus Dojkabacteria bacterium]|jgi:SAM-dependent methyltransferase
MLNGISLAVILIFISFLTLFIITVLVNVFLVPVIGTSEKILNEILEIMDLQKSDVFYDLGSGDGRMVLRAYEEAKCRCIGYDISPISILISRTKRILKFPRTNDISFELEDIFSVNLSDSTKIYCYLNTESMNILKKKLEKYIKDGGYVYSYIYKIQNMKCSGKYVLSNGDVLYVYTSKIKD